MGFVLRHVCHRHREHSDGIFWLSQIRRGYFRCCVVEFTRELVSKNSKLGERIGKSSIIFHVIAAGYRKQ